MKIKYDSTKSIVYSISLIILLFFIADICIADEYLYIRPETKYGGDPGGQSWKGDVVEITLVSPQNYPTTKEINEYVIIKTSEIPSDDKVKYKEKWKDNGSILAYRKWWIKDFDSEGLLKGINEGTKDWDTFKVKLKEKKEKDLEDWEEGQMAYLDLKMKFWMLTGWLSPRPAYALTVNTSTINKTGEDYNTITLWEDAVDGDLVSEDRMEIAECYNDDGQLDDKPVIFGSITDSTRYLKITVPEGERHNGTVNQTGFTLAPSTAGSVLENYDSYTVIEYIAVTGYDAEKYAHDWAIVALDSYTIIRYCMIYDSVGSGDGNCHGIGTFHNTGVYVYSNIIIDNEDIGIYCNSNSTFYNNVIMGCGSDGFKRINGTPILINNVSVLNTGLDFNINGGSWHATSDYNASEDLTAPDGGGGHSITGITPSDNFTNVTAGNQDAHCKDTGADIYGTGTVLNIALHDGTAVSEDFEGDSIPQNGNAEIGADEYLQVATPTPTETPTPECSVNIDGDLETAAIYIYEVCGVTSIDLDYTGSNCYGGSFSWASSDELVATVDADGIVAAVSIGDATISITCDTIPACTDSILITVLTCITPTATQTATPTATATQTATLTVTATETATLTATPTETATQTATATQIATITATPTVTATPTITIVPFYRQLHGYLYDYVELEGKHETKELDGIFTEYIELTGILEIEK